MPSINDDRARLDEARLRYREARLALINADKGGSLHELLKTEAGQRLSSATKRLVRMQAIFHRRGFFADITCPVCQEEHEHMEFQYMVDPMETDAQIYHYVGWCPRIGKAILWSGLRPEEEDER